jgi:hypothetical protein
VAEDGEPDAEDQDKIAPPHQHNKGRARFQGDVRGRSATFRPRASRGGQRGS